MMLMLHAGAPLAPHDMWTAWSLEPAAMFLISLGGALYWRGSREMSERTTRARATLRRERLFFWAGLLVLLVALVSPLHRAGGVLFTAHMIQHELLMTVAAPLLVLGRPALPTLWALPANARKSIGDLIHHPDLASVWRWVSAPLAAWILHAGAIWLWHLPSLYDASVQSEVAHTAQHLSFMLTALLFWWSVIDRSRSGSHAGIAMICLFTTALHTSLLGALLSAAEMPLYQSYKPTATGLWGLSPLEDQQLGGIVMWVPGGVAYLIAALLLFLRWMKSSGERTLARDTARRAMNVSARLAALVVVAALVACSTNNDQAAAEMTGGNPHSGREAIRRYGCQSCHSIPGVRGATALVGPPLAGIADRSYIAGVISNTPAHMIEWLRNPPAIDEKTAMPNMNVSEKDARDIAAYLYTLR